MFDNDTRALVGHEHFEQLRRDVGPIAPSTRRRARRSVGDWLIRLGERLAREPGPACREINSRA
jgi:hypothetical protein